MKSQTSNPSLDVAAALLLAISVTMVTDFTHRLLSSDPDSVGIFSVSIQAAFTVAATSTFTRAGWSWLGNALKHFGKDVQDRGRWRFGLSLTLFAVIVPLWYFLPTRLSDFYNTRGFNLRNNAPAEALRDYQRAIALDPTRHLAYVNLGGVLEVFYRYDDAVKEYRRAIAADATDPTPYNNLSRLLLLGNDPMTALRITDDELRLHPKDAHILAALEKNRAWAEYDLGFYSQALIDATQSNTAAGECLLGKIYGKLGKTNDARSAWDNFRQRIASAAPDEPKVEPECPLLAKEENEKN